MGRSLQEAMLSVWWDPKLVPAQKLVSNQLYQSGEDLTVA
jgi:hypothetical protein